MPTQNKFIIHSFIPFYHTEWLQCSALCCTKRPCRCYQGLGTHEVQSKPTEKRWLDSPSSWLLEWTSRCCAWAYHLQKPSQLKNKRKWNILSCLHLEYIWSTVRLVQQNASIETCRIARLFIHMQEGMGALHLAAAKGCDEIVQELLDAGVAPDMQDKVANLICITYIVGVYTT